MIHLDGTTHLVDLSGKNGFNLSLPSQRGIHNGGDAVVAPQSATRVIAYALDFVPFGVNMAEANKYEALRLHDEQPLSFDNVGWFEKGETSRRRIRVSEEAARDTDQEELEGEQFANVKYRQYDINGGIANTWVNYDGKFQVSTFGRMRFVLGDNGVFHYTKGSMNGQGYLNASIHRFAINRRVPMHILVMHTFCGFPDDLGYDPRVTTVDHVDRVKTNNVLYNLHYANLSQQALNRNFVLQKYGVDCFADLPQDMLTQAKEYVARIPDKQLRTTLEMRASKCLKDAANTVMQQFLRGSKLCDLSAYEQKQAAIISESMFIFEYDELKQIFEESDWVLPCDDWKTLNIKLMKPRKRVDIIDALRAVNVTLDRTATLKDPVQRIRVALLFNRVMMYHFHLAKLATESIMAKIATTTSMSSKRGRDGKIK
jgi:hypothetical protein